MKYLCPASKAQSPISGWPTVGSWCRFAVPKCSLLWDYSVEANPMNMSTSRGNSALLVFTAAIGIAALTIGRGENILGYGIWSHKSDVVLFAQVYPCSPNELPPPGAAQLLISKDGGIHWGKSGPQLDGSEFEYMHEEGARVWIVGEHKAEGPASEAFILAPDEESFAWSRHVIYEGASELQGVAISETGGFVAWIRHFELGDNGWTGPLYVHESSDEGRTWRVVGRAKKTIEGPGNGFKKIEKETPVWRVTNQEGGGSAIEHRVNNHSAWKLVAAFPYRGCGR